MKVFIERNRLPFESLVVATGNAGKLEQIRRQLAVLRIPIRALIDFEDVVEVAEDGSTIQQNARLKASGYAKQLERWVIADDTGLEVDALGGAPGIHTARYAGEHATPADRRRKLLNELARFDHSTWDAQFVCSLAIANPEGLIQFESNGVCRGRIVTEEAGENGIGYDRIFEIIECHKRLAEFGPIMTDVISHRGRAMRALLRKLVANEEGLVR